MIYDILLFNILLPVALGVLISLLVLTLAQKNLIAGLLMGAGCTIIMLLLNGIPRIPPITSSERLAVAVIGLMAVSLILHRFGCVGTTVTLAIWLAGAAWIAGARIQDSASLPRVAASVAVILAAGGAALRMTRSDHIGLARIVPLLAFTIVAAFLSLIGGFIGNAQTLGAFAALIGGVTLIAYLVDIGMPRLQTSLLPSAVVIVALCAVVLIVGHTAMYTPDIHWVAMIIAATILLLPDLLDRIPGLNKALAPFVFTAVSAVPGAVAIGLALF